MTVYDEIQAERERQDAKWGEQDIPSVPEVIAQRTPGWSAADWMCVRHFALSTEDQAKRLCDDRTFMKTLTHPDIVTEEYVEAIAKFAVGDDKGGREELVQLAATVVKWIQCVDRRKERAG